MRFVLVLVVVAACYSPGYQDCEITCASGSCPAGLTCSSGMCRAPGMSGACNVVPGEDANPGDTPLDVADAAPIGPWSTPTPVLLQPLPPAGSVNRQPTLSSDLLELYFIRDNIIHKVTRTSVSQPWSQVEPDFLLSDSATSDDSPALAANGLAIYFASRRSPSLDFDLWFSTRVDLLAPWDPPRHIQELASNLADRGVAVTNDELSLVFHTLDSLGVSRVWISERAGATNAWVPPTELQALGQFPGGGPEDPMLSADKLTIYFHARDANSTDLYEASRPGLTQPFGPPTRIPELNSSRSDESPWISPDGRHMFFASDRNGIMEIWESRR